MQPRTLPTVLLATGALFAFVPAGPLAAQTTSVPITNFSFEQPSQADGTTSVGLTGWSVVGNTFQTITIPGIPPLVPPTTIQQPLTESILTSNPTNAQYFGTSGAGAVGTMNGSQIASFRTGALNLTGSASQIVPTNLLTLATQYTLTVAVGNPLDSAFQGYTISIISGTTSLGSITETTGGVPTDGTFRDVSLSFVLNDLAPLATVGGLIVSLSVPGVPLTSAVQDYGTDFDNVRLTSTPVIVPEPSTIASACVGLLGLLGVQYFRRRRGFSAPLRA